MNNNDDDNLAAIDDPRVVQCRRLIAQLDACQGINDPDRAIAAKDNAFARGMALIKLLLGGLIIERMGAARLARAYLKLSPPWGDKALEAGRGPVQPASPNMDPDETAAQRWMLARFIQDFEDVLPPNLARNHWAAMLSLNLGVETPFTRPLRVKGLRNGAAPSATFNFFKATLVYYLAGYRGVSIEQVLRDDAELFGRMGYDALKSIVHRLEISEMVSIARSKGAADKIAGQPEDPEYTGCRDFIAYMNATRGK